MRDQAIVGSVDNRYRVGVLGYGGIGRNLVDFLNADDRFELAFVHNRTSSSIPSNLVAQVALDLDDVERFGAQLIVEAAHPDYTVHRGAQFLAHAHYLPVSTSALADDALRQSLINAATAADTQLLLPHGALVGLDSLVAERSIWSSVHITFRKPPGSLERADGSTVAAVEDSDVHVLYDGSVRGIASLYPRNVNSMITLALATCGLDDTRATLIADPHEARGVLEVTALGRDESALTIRREQPMRGVSGTEMFGSILESLKTAAGPRLAGVRFV